MVLPDSTSSHLGDRFGVAGADEGVAEIRGLLRLTGGEFLNSL